MKNNSIEQSVLKELYELNNWPDINSEQENIENSLSENNLSFDINNTDEDKSVFTIWSNILTTKGIVEEPNKGPKNVVELIDNVNNLAKLYKDMGLLE
jgi:hypothetical protein